MFLSFAVGKFGDDVGGETREGILDGDAEGVERRGFVRGHLVDVDVEESGHAREECVDVTELGSKLTKRTAGMRVSKPGSKKEGRSAYPFSFVNSSSPKSNTSLGTLTSSSSLSSTITTFRLATFLSSTLPPSLGAPPTGPSSPGYASKDPLSPCHAVAKMPPLLTLRLPSSPLDLYPAPSVSNPARVVSNDESGFLNLGRRNGP